MSRWTCPCAPAPGGVPLTTRTTYTSAGLLQSLTTNSGANSRYTYGSVAYDLADRITDASETAAMGGHQSSAQHFVYDTLGSGRLRVSNLTLESAPGNPVLGRSWTYDVFGNRTTETVSDPTGTNPTCTAPQPLEYALTNQLLVRHSAPGCPNYAHYWSDQAGQRLGATDSLSQLPGIREALSYTAQGQLYYAVTATDSPGDYDFNWNWYDASGLRVMAALYTQEGVNPPPQPLTLQGGTWAYYLYDGPELGLVLRRSGTTVKIQQRFVSAGVDGALAGRFWVTGASAQSLALLTDHQGTTLAALNPNGTEAAGYVYKPLSAFGASDDPTASPVGVWRPAARGSPGPARPTRPAGWSTCGTGGTIPPRAVPHPGSAGAGGRGESLCLCGKQSGQL